MVFLMAVSEILTPKFNKQVQHFRFLGFRIMIADYAKNLQTVKSQ